MFRRRRKEIDGQLSLFDVPPPESKETQQRRHVGRIVAAGYHPTTGLPLASSPDMRCGSCIFRARRRGPLGLPSGRSYCVKARFYGGGQAERTTKSWQACVLYEPDGDPLSVREWTPAQPTGEPRTKTIRVRGGVL